MLACACGEAQRPNLDGPYAEECKFAPLRPSLRIAGHDCANGVHAAQLLRITTSRYSHRAAAHLCGACCSSSVLCFRDLASRAALLVFDVGILSTHGRFLSPLATVGTVFAPRRVVLLVRDVPLRSTLLARPWRPMEGSGASTEFTTLVSLRWRRLRHFVILFLGTGLYPTVRERHRRPP